MNAALFLDVGDLVSISETQTGISGYYYIQGVRMSISLGHIVSFSWVVKQAFSLFAGLSLLAVDFAYLNPGGGARDAIDFGHLPSLNRAGLPMSFAAWIFPNSPPDDLDPLDYVIAGNYNNVSGVDHGWLVGLSQYSTSENIFFLRGQLGGRGAWFTDVGSITMDAWNHIALTYDNALTTNDPVIYINGVSVNVNESSAPIGAIDTDEVLQFVIGNIANSGLDYPFGGQIADVRIYDRILTAAEIAAIHFGSLGDVNESPGLMFQAPCVRTSELAQYVSAVLTAENKLIDNIRGEIGTPIGVPVGRALP